EARERGETPDPGGCLPAAVRSVPRGGELYGVRHVGRGRRDLLGAGILQGVRCGAALQPGLPEQTRVSHPGFRARSATAFGLTRRSAGSMLRHDPRYVEPLEES